eukprot:361895-Chlamydomonas_euryale.AAC.6
MAGRVVEMHRDSSCVVLLNVAATLRRERANAQLPLPSHVSSSQSLRGASFGSPCGGQAARLSPPPSICEHAISAGWPLQFDEAG